MPLQRKKTNDCLQYVPQWLNDLGIPETSLRHYKNPERIKVFLRSSSGRRYDVNFITDTGGDVIIESVVSKSASSNNVSNDRIFYQTLLGYIQLFHTWLLLSSIFRVSITLLLKLHFAVVF